MPGQFVMWFAVSLLWDKNTNLPSSDIVRNNVLLKLTLYQVEGTHVLRNLRHTSKETPTTDKHNYNFAKNSPEPCQILRTNKRGDTRHDSLNKYSINIYNIK